MGASAGRYGVGIGMGAASGAGAGAFLGPVGAVVGGGLGALGGALSTLLSSSDEAKERERQRQAYLQQQQENAGDDWERRYAAITGIANDPMYMAMSYKPYDPAKANADFDAHMPEEPTPNYGGLVQSLGSLGSTVGTLNRQSAAQEQLDQLMQNQRNGQAQARGMPWGGYSSGGGSWY